MEVDFRLPSLGADMEAATLTQWLKKPGDAIRHGEAIATVETEKGLIDIETYDDGTLGELLVQPGTKVPVGAVLARLTVEKAAAAAAPAPLPTAAAPLPPTAHPAAAEARPQPTPGAAAGERARISPAARRRAHELGVPADVLERSAAGGVLHVEDVERLAEQAAKPAVQKAEAPGGGRAAMRTAIGSAMARSKREIPHYYLGQDVDFGSARDWLARHNAQASVQERLIETVLIVKAVALAASRVEGFSGYFINGRFERSETVHVGTAIAVRGGGLVAPALLDVPHKDLATVMREFSALVSRVRAGRLRSGEFSAATITVTSLGTEGVDVLYPIINPPQVAIVGTGAVRDQPWIRDGQVVARPVLTLALAADHRVTDGRSGARFLRAVAELLERPGAL